MQSASKMQKTKLVLLGGSNSVILKGLQQGLQQEHIELTNLALGGTDNLQNLFEIVHSKNQQSLKEADFIIIETNINDSHMIPKGFSVQVIGRNLAWLCERLYQLGKRVIWLILPFVNDNPALNAFLKKNANHYGFNVIDMHERYVTQGLIQFFNTNDAYHQIYPLMSLMGEKIIESLEDFKPLKPNASKAQILPQFKILTPPSLLGAESLLPFSYNNSAYREVAFRVKRNDKLYFTGDTKDYVVVGIKVWNFGLQNRNKMSFVLENTQTKIVKIIERGILLVHSLRDILWVDEATCFRINTENEPMSESSTWLDKEAKVSADIDYIDVVEFYLARGGKWDYEIPPMKRVEVESEYDFSHLVPNVGILKEIIEEYCARMDRNKFTSLERQIKALKDSKQNSKIVLVGADLRIKSHLSFRLGNAMVLNSKSLWGMIRLPCVLSYIDASYKQEQQQYQDKIAKNPALKLPPLESYADYQESLKIKNYASYKLGEGLIAATHAKKGRVFLYLFKAFVARIFGLKIS